MKIPTDRPYVLLDDAKMDQYRNMGGFDIIGSGRDKIETPEEVAATLKLATEFVDPERIQACTNCGMAPMTAEVAYGKLAALSAGAALVRKELGAA